MSATTSARPPPSGTSRAWSRRASGRSIIPSRAARRAANGVRATAITPASRNAATARWVRSSTAPSYRPPRRGPGAAFRGRSPRGQPGESATTGAAMADEIDRTEHDDDVAELSDTTGLNDPEPDPADVAALRDLPPADE